MTLTPRPVFLGFLGTSLAVLATAYGFEFLGGLKPCALCLYQRVPYGLAAGIALGAFFFSPHRRAAVGLLFLLAILFFGNGLLALYHVGVERGWVAASCGGVGASESLDALRQSLLNTQPAQCDEISWSFLGLSMAGVNAIVSIGLAICAMTVARIFGKRSGA